MTYKDSCASTSNELETKCKASLQLLVEWMTDLLIELDPNVGVLDEVRGHGGHRVGNHLLGTIHDHIHTEAHHSVKCLDVV